MRNLFLFGHGLGDCCQFTVVLKHLRHYRPDEFIAVVTEPGRESVFEGIADQFWPSIHPHEWKLQQWDQILEVDFRRPTMNYDSWPNSKITECLMFEMGFRPMNDLYRYEMKPQKQAEEKAERFIAERFNGPVAFCHFFSEVSAEPKHLTEEEGEAICGELLARGITPLVLDLKRKAKRQEGVVYLDPSANLFDRWGDAQILRSLIARAELFVGIDSGPAHIAAATETPSVVIWRSTVAPYCFDPAPNVLHLIPDDMPERMHEEGRDASLVFFHDNYRYQTYSNLLEHLRADGLNTSDLLQEDFTR